MPKRPDLSEDGLRALRDARVYLDWIRRQGLIVPRDELAAAGASGVSRDATANLPEAPTVARRAAEPPPAMAGGPVAADAPDQFARLRAAVESCRKCALGHQRKNAVFGIGNPKARLVFIGEAPGATEDEQGKPFVGAAGNLLTRELKKHGVERDEVFICNILKCRPPGNRDPLPEEIAACEPYLLEQLRLIGPQMLCGLGRFAVMTLLKRQISIMKIRGTWERYEGLPLFVCLHPAAVLHQPQSRPLFEADIKALCEAYRRGTP
jgi:DNA polymerase